MLKKYWGDILALAGLILIVFVYFSGPVCDSDFWWQMKYGEYMLSHHTLVPDHTVYSWFPSDNATIYCAWIPQLVMYCAYTAGGLPAIYLLRYLIFFLSVLPVYLYMRKEAAGNKALCVAVILTLCWILSPSIAVRPTLFSLPCISAMFWVYFTVKRDQARRRLLYLFPVIMLVWVNSHGLFIFGGVFLFLAFAGELLNYRFGTENRMEAVTLRHFFAASALAAFAVFVTPYGYAYPVNLVVQIFADSEYMKWTNDNVMEFLTLHQSNRILFWIAVSECVILSVMTIRAWIAKRRDLGFALIIFAMAAMAFYYYRLTMLFGYAAAFMILCFLSGYKIKKNAGRVIAAASVAYIVIFAGTTVTNTIYTPLTQGDPLNSDIRYQCAYEESAFVKRCGFKKVGNDQNIGSYMLWALGPDTKIMIDPRWFPYKAHLNEFTRLWQNPYELLLYFNKQNCDAWVLSYPFGKELSYLFYNINDWKVGFYGQFGLVFVKKDFPPVPEGERLGDLRHVHNIAAATNILMIACDLNDWKGAEEVLHSFDHNFKKSVFGGNIQIAHLYYKGRRALFEKDYRNAAVQLELCGAGIPVGLMPYASQMFALEEWEKGNDLSAYMWSLKAWYRQSDNAISLYNSGVIGWWLKKQLLEGKVKDIKVDENWSKNIQTFLIKEKGNQGTSPAQDICRKILAGTYAQKPPLLYPSVPRVLSFVAVDK